MKESHETRLMGQICVSGWNRIGPAQADDTIVNMVVDMIMYWLSSDEASDITEDANVTWSWCGTFLDWHMAHVEWLNYRIWERVGLHNDKQRLLEALLS